MSDTKYAKDIKMYFEPTALKEIDFDNIATELYIIVAMEHHSKQRKQLRNPLSAKKKGNECGITTKSLYFAYSARQGHICPITLEYQMV